MTHQNQNSGQLLENEERFRDLVEHVSDWIWEVDQNGVYTYASPRITEILGFTPAEVVGKTPFDLMKTEEAERIRPIFNTLVANKLPIKSLENVNIHRNGYEVILETSGNPIINEQGECVGYRGVDRDITLRKDAERRQQQMLDIIEASPDFIATADIDGKTMYLNPAARKMLGIHGKEDIPFVSWNSNWSRELVLNKGIETAIKEGLWKGETSILKQDGTETPVSQIIVAHKSDNGAVQFFSTIARDISETKELENKISRQALYDSLTDLPNRRFFHQRLSQVIADPAVGKKAALLFMDLNNFKLINDTLGHHYGDCLLKEIAIRLRRCLQEQEFICRYGGDEFIILLENMQDHNKVERVVRQILIECNQPIFLDAHSIEVSISIGISLYPEHGKDEDTLIRRADQMMYEVKRQGKSDFQILSPVE